MSFRWENCVRCTLPPTLSLPKVSCQLINHLCPVLCAKNHFHFDFKENKAEYAGIGVFIGITYVTWKKDPETQLLLG